MRRAKSQQLLRQPRRIKRCCIKIRSITASALNVPPPLPSLRGQAQARSSKSKAKSSCQLWTSKPLTAECSLNSAPQFPHRRHRDRHLVRPHQLLHFRQSHFECSRHQIIFKSMAMERARHGYVALLWLGIWLTAFCHSATAQCSAAESAALLKFKSVVLDPRGDLSTWSVAGANCCSWRGIECSRSGVGAIRLLLDAPVRGRTVTLDPNNPSASAIAGDALAQLTQLVFLHTDWVVWRSPLPLQQISKLPLRELVIRNGLLGNRSPPDSIGGALQNDIGNLAGTLEVLTLMGTNYNSGLPSALCKLAKLRVLEVSGSLMSNLGPSCLSNITGLQEVRMMANPKVTGGLPVWPTALPNLKVLDFSNNAHSGNIPVQYGKLGAVDLHLAGNHLAGRVPAGLSAKPTSTFRPGNEKLCGAPLPECPV